MTHRDRWLRTMHYQPVDHVPDEEFGYWAETLLAWHEQGLPREIDTLPKADLYFGFAPRDTVPANPLLVPAFETEILEDRGDKLLLRDSDGVTCLVPTKGECVPLHIGFLLKGRVEWEREFKPRLNPDHADRRPSPDALARLSAGWSQRDYPLGLWMGGLYGVIRNWMGFEGAAMLLHDDPGLLEEMMEQLTLVTLRNIEVLSPYAQLDFGSMWEDMCYNKGPMISPRDFERLMVPRYRRLVEALKQTGCDVVYVDCDGNINQLVSLWLEAGVNCMFPVEVAGGTDPIALRDTYGSRVLLMGGVNKRALIAGPEAIRQEIQRIAPTVAEGGWIPHVDHRVPPDVTLDNYRYYLALKRDTFGLPAPEPWEQRRPLEWGQGIGE